MEIFFRSPWCDPDCTSLVYVERDGAIRAFVGAFPRSMIFEGEPCKVVVATQLMVDPECSAGLAVIQLLRTLFAGKQDLVLTDGATHAVRRLWTRLGATTLLLQSLCWTRPLRPCRHLAGYIVAKRPLLRPVAAGMTPMFALADAIGARMRPNRFHRVDTTFQTHELNANTMLDGIQGVDSKSTLWPVYDERSLRWLLRCAAEKRRQGDLQRVLVRSAQGAMVGWYLYYLNRTMNSEVLQIVAVPGREEDVFRHLLQHAWQRGALAVAGRLDSQFWWAIGENHTYFSRSGPLTLCYSRRPELVAALRSGEATFSRLEAEYWMRFIGG